MAVPSRLDYPNGSRVFIDEAAKIDEYTLGRLVRLPRPLGVSGNAVTSGTFRSAIMRDDHLYDVMSYATSPHYLFSPGISSIIKVDDSFLTRIKKGISKMFGKERRIARLKKIESLEKDVAYYKDLYCKVSSTAEDLRKEVDRLTPAPEPDKYVLTYLWPDGTTRIETVKAHNFGANVDFHFFYDHKDNVVAKFSNEGLRSMVKS